jgi:Flp pilus assembly protein TadD
LAQAQDRLGEGAKSESSLRALARLRPGYGPGLAYLGKLLFESGRLEEAAQELERALALGCGDPGWGASEAKLGFQAACLLARAYERIGRPLAGWRAWRAASSFAPDHPEPYVAMAETSMAGGDRAAAKELIERAISLAPAHRRALMVSSHLEAGR